MTTIQTSIDLLVEPFRGQIRGLLAEAMERRVYFVVTETLRGINRQQMLVEQGKSRTLKSHHLTGHAVDVALVGNYSGGIVHEIAWDKEHPVWKVLGELAEKWGVIWGGTWESFPDYPHLEARV